MCYYLGRGQLGVAYAGIGMGQGLARALGKPGGSRAKPRSRIVPAGRETKHPRGAVTGVL